MLTHDEPRCPTVKDHGPLVLRELRVQTAQQRYCGTWFDCTAYRCKSAVLVPSAELLAQLDAQRKAVNRWARQNGWRRVPLFGTVNWQSPDGMTRLVWNAWRVRVFQQDQPDGVWPFSSYVRVTSVRQAVDVLVALGILPLEFDGEAARLRTALDAQTRNATEEYAKGHSDAAAWLFGVAAVDPHVWQYAEKLRAYAEEIRRGALRAFDEREAQ